MEGPPSRNHQHGDLLDLSMDLRGDYPPAPVEVEEPLAQYRPYLYLSIRPGHRKNVDLRADGPNKQ